MRRHPNWLNREAAWERWNLIAPWTGEMTMDEWKALTKVGRCAWAHDWQTKRINSTVPTEKLHVLHVEDFGDVRKLADAFEFMGYPAPTSMPRENASNDNCLPTRDWTEQENDEFERLCG